MYEIAMDEMTPEFFRCWSAAGQHLNRCVDGGIQTWLRGHPYPPFLEHLSFRLGNQIFVIRVEDVDARVHGPSSLDGLLYVAEEIGAHACILPMRHHEAHQRWHACNPGWGLIDSARRMPINPIELVNEDRIEMSAWEFQDFAVQVVRQHLEEKGHRLMSWQGNPAVDPSIWFFGESGGPEWVIVRPAMYPEQLAQLPDNWLEIAHQNRKLSTIGHFASVRIESFEQASKGHSGVPLPTWRGDPIEVNFESLERLPGAWGGA